MDALIINCKWLFVFALLLQLSLCNMKDQSNVNSDEMESYKRPRVDADVKEPYRICKEFEDPEMVDCQRMLGIKTNICTEPPTFSPCVSKIRIQVYHYDHIKHRCILMDLPACPGMIIRSMTLFQCLIYCHNKDPFALGKSTSIVHKLNQDIPYFAKNTDEEPIVKKDLTDWEDSNIMDSEPLKSKKEFKRTLEKSLEDEKEAPMKGNEQETKENNKRQQDLEKRNFDTNDHITTKKEKTKRMKDDNRIKKTQLIAEREENHKSDTKMSMKHQYTEKKKKDDNVGGTSVDITIISDKKSDENMKSTNDKESIGEKKRSMPGKSIKESSAKKMDTINHPDSKVTDDNDDDGFYLWDE